MPEPYPLLDRDPVDPRGVNVHIWAFLSELSDAFPGQWALVGGQMVLLHGLEAGEVPDRETTDADALVDIRVAPRGTVAVSRWLEDHGIRQDGISPDGIGHRFRGRGLVVDVLAPDHMGARATLATVGPARTVQVPSGRRLLASVQRTPVDCGGHVACVPRPDLAAAIVGKAAAQVLPSPERHQLDLVFLLGLIDDVTVTDAALSARIAASSPPRRISSTRTGSGEPPAVPPTRKQPCATSSARSACAADRVEQAFLVRPLHGCLIYRALFLG